MTFAGICCALNGGIVAGVAAYMTAMSSWSIWEGAPWSACLVGISVPHGWLLVLLGVGSVCLCGDFCVCK